LGHIVQTGELCFESIESTGTVRVGRAVAEGVVRQLSFDGKFSVENMDYRFDRPAVVPYGTKERFIELLCLDSVEAVNRERGEGEFKITGGVYVYLNQGKNGELVFSPNVPVKGIRIVVREKFYQAYLKNHFPQEPLDIGRLFTLNNTSCLNPELRLVFGQIRQNVEAGVTSGLYYESKITEILYLITAKDIAAHRAHRKLNLGRSLTQEDFEAVRRVKAIIGERLSDSPTIRELASLSGTSAAKLQNDFKAAYGETIHAYVQKVRMAEALNKVGNTDEPLCAIARDIGCKNPSRFSELFKRTYGVTPTEYRTVNGK
jgi:AraC-like DNA-binding protein